MRNSFFCLLATFAVLNLSFAGDPTQGKPIPASDVANLLTSSANDFTFTYNSGETDGFVFQNVHAQDNAVTFTIHKYAGANRCHEVHAKSIADIVAQDSSPGWLNPADETITMSGPFQKADDEDADQGSFIVSNQKQKDNSSLMLFFSPFSNRAELTAMFLNQSNGYSIDCSSDGK